MSETKFDIYDIMACDVFWDYGTPGLPKEQHKFLVAFYATHGKFHPDLVDAIKCFGPDGYETEIVNQKFTGENRNGFIHDKTTDNYWYMHNCATGFMKDGEYRIEVRCRNGEVKTKSRVQSSAASRNLVKSYLANAGKMAESFSPSERKKMPEGASLSVARIRWSTLKELSGQDAYYIHRLAEGASKSEWDVQKLVWWDNIFIQRIVDPTAGLNRAEVIVNTTLKPKTPYLYFVEITDSNAMGQTNICIFQPFRQFTTPSIQTSAESGTAARG
jgi:hypothetical protein